MKVLTLERSNNISINFKDINILFQPHLLRKINQKSYLRFRDQSLSSNITSFNSYYIRQDLKQPYSLMPLKKLGDSKLSIFSEQSRNIWDISRKVVLSKQIRASSPDFIKDLDVVNHEKIAKRDSLRTSKTASEEIIPSLNLLVSKRDLGLVLDNIHHMNLTSCHMCKDQTEQILEAQDSKSALLLNCWKNDSGQGANLEYFSKKHGEHSFQIEKDLAGNIVLKVNNSKNLDWWRSQNSYFRVAFLALGYNKFYLQIPYFK